MVGSDGIFDLLIGIASCHIDIDSLVVPICSTLAGTHQHPLALSDFRRIVVVEARCVSGEVRVPMSSFVILSKTTFPTQSIGIPKLLLLSIATVISKFPHSCL